MAVGAALPGDEAQQQALVHPDSLGGGEVLCHEDARLGALQRRVVHPLQNIEDGLRDVDDIGAAGLQIGVVHSRKDGGLIVSGGLDGILGAAVLAVDDLFDGVHEVVVVQHHGMDVEHLGDVLAGLSQSLLVEGGLLVDGLGAGVLKTGHFSGGVSHFGGRDDGIFFLIDLELADGDAIQDALTGAYLHCIFSLFHRFHLRNKKPPQAFPARASHHTGRSDVLAQEFLDCFGAGGLVVALHLDGHGVALLDAHAHQGHQLAQVAGLACLFEGSGACKALGHLDEQAGGTCVDAAGILNGVLEFLHDHFLLTSSDPSRSFFTLPYCRFFIKNFSNIEQNIFPEIPLLHIFSASPHFFVQNDTYSTG